MSDDIRRLSDELARDPSSLVFVPLADALRRTGQLDIALRVALRGLDRHPYVADAHDVLARIHADRGELERAADEWGMALRLDPSHAAARKGLGFVDFRRGDLASAERRLAEASNGTHDSGVATALAHVRSALAARSESIGVADARTPSNDIEMSGGAVAEPGATTVAAAGEASVAEPDVTSVAQLGREPAHEPVHEPSRDSSAELAGDGASAQRSFPAEFPPPETRHARGIFAPILERDQAALLLDEDGLVLAGSYVDGSGTDVAEFIGAELAGVSSEAERALRHLGLGAWTSLLVEAEGAIAAMSPAPRGALMLVAASRETPVGLVRLLLDRALARARDWLARLT